MLNLSPTEREILEVLWEHGPMGNGELSKYFAERGKQWKRQTVNTFFSRLMEKGLVVRENHKYAVSCTKREFEQRQAREVLGTLYEGSLKNFIAALGGGESLTEQEARELNSLIDGWEKQRL